MKKTLQTLTHSTPLKIVTTSYYARLSPEKKRQYLDRRKEYRDRNKEKIHQRFKEYRAENKERLYDDYLLWRSHNQEKVLEYNRRWKHNNKAHDNFISMQRHARKRKAIPLWYEKQQVEYVYQRAKELSQIWFKTLEVDHIIPLSSKTVCGLHCFSNLQILEQSINRTKSNTYVTDW
ncbi:MAG: hypothetical protein ACYCZQ_03235 [Burkholderiales bacterium]